MISVLVAPTQDHPSISERSDGLMSFRVRSVCARVSQF